MENQSSITSLVSAFSRAFHTENEACPVFSDTKARELMTDAEYRGGEIADGLEVVEIPAYTYAVFTVKGKMPDAFRETYRRICTEFFASSDYEYGNGAEIEVYPSADVQNPDYTCEIWIAVNHK